MSQIKLLKVVFVFIWIVVIYYFIQNAITDLLAMLISKSNIIRVYANDY